MHVGWLDLICPDWEALEERTGVQALQGVLQRLQPPWSPAPSTHLPLLREEPRPELL